MRVSSLAALIGAALVISLSDSGGTASRAPGAPLFAAFLEPVPVPQPEATEDDQEYQWQLIPVRHADAVALSIAMGGGVAPMNGDRPKAAAPGGGFNPLAIIIPDGIQGIIAIPATNSLRVRGTREDIAELRRSVEAFDQPQTRYRLTLSAGIQTVSASTLERETAHLEDNSGNRRLAVDLIPRQTLSGDLIIEVDGNVTAAAREWKFSTITRLKPGYRARIAEFGSLQGRTGIYLHADIDPDAQIARAID